MTRDVRRFGLLTLVSALSFAGCKTPANDAPPPAQPTPTQEPTPAPTEQPAPGEPASAAPALPPATPKVDPADLGALKAGRAAMLPRVKAETEAAAKITPTDHSRFFMHPGDDKNAAIEFDTKGLKSVDLSPYIEDLASNPDCASNPTAGVAHLTWSADGKKVGELTVDRNYTGTVTIDVSKTSRLKLEVDKGNGTSLCDWFSVGVLNVK